jgi:hypothetical protein
MSFDTSLSIERWGLPLAQATSLVACGGDCADEIAAAGEFLQANQTCASDADCVVVQTGCHTYDELGGGCGQASLSRDAANTAEWRRLNEALLECKTEGSQCMAQLVPRCGDGVCGGGRM